MDQGTKEQLWEHFNKLPEEVRKTFPALNISQKLEAIPDVQPLSEDQKVMIKNEIILIFLGLRSPFELTTNIKYGAEIARERAENITHAIERTILSPNMHLLEQVFDTQDNEEPKRVVTDGIERREPSATVSHVDMYRESVDDAESDKKGERIPLKAVPDVTRNRQVPSPIRTMSTDMEQPKNSLDIFRERLAKPVSTPVEQTVLEEKGSTAQTPKPQRNAEVMPKKEAVPPASSAPKGHDPYRESIN